MAFFFLVFVFWRCYTLYLSHFLGICCPTSNNFTPKTLQKRTSKFIDVEFTLASVIQV